MTFESEEEKLLPLCDKQLHAAVRDAESSIFRVTEDLMFSMRAVSILSDSLAEKLTENERSLFSVMEKNFNGILTHLQFFDEFNQRISHVRQVLDLLQRDGKGLLREAGEGERKGVECLLKDIFSMQAEYETMRELFPHIEPERNVSSVELF